MNITLVDISFTVFIICFSLAIVILTAGAIWYCFLKDWWKGRKKPKTFKIVVDLDKLVVNSPDGIAVDCFKDSRRNKVHLIIREVEDGNS